MSVTSSTEEKHAVLDVQQPYTSTQEEAASYIAKERTHSSSIRGTKEMMRWLSMLPPVILALVLLIGWYMSAAAGIVKPLFLPAPGDVFASLADGLRTGLYLSSTFVTIQES